MLGIPYCLAVTISYGYHVMFRVYDLRIKHTSTQKNHTPNIIKEYDFLRWITRRPFTVIYYFIFETRLNIPNVLFMLRECKNMKIYSALLFLKTHIFK